MFSRILIANRGEIACRIIRSCRALGVETVAVYSDADRNALHVREADLAVHIGAATATESYLNIPRIIDAARQTDCQAVHPGYGFLSENTAFAQTLADAGLVFIGPSVQTIEQMGSKADAKRVMQAAGVPTVPGYHGDDQTDEQLAQQAQKTGFPLMIKAAAGGGGKGMRIVTGTEEFAAALASARREANKAFGDDRVILERYIQQPRHIEVQVFGDHKGNVVHLFERDCSSQRRYQKIIEECPAPNLPEGQRQAMCQAAVDAAKAVDYSGAGTVEFIVEGGNTEHFYFMEMNTRLQVEHPVTEMVTGLDLVEWQLRIAAGEQLPLSQQQISSQGHAIEARIYAEDPTSGFLPSSGNIEYLALPQAGDHIRIDSGVRQGDDISIHYDPMIAKLIVLGADRRQALARLQQALAASAIIGPASNLGFLQTLTQHPKLQSGNMDSAYLDRHLQQVISTETTPDMLLAAVLVELLDQEHCSRVQAASGNDPYSPWAESDGWRPGHPGKRIVWLRAAEQELEFHCFGHSGSYNISDGEQHWAVSSAEFNSPSLDYELQNQRYRLQVHHQDDCYAVVTATRRATLRRISPLFELSGPLSTENDIKAPMPGQVIAIHASAGELAQPGQELMIMEAMKMELSLKAPIRGRIIEINAETGQFVEADTLLIRLEPEDA